MSEMISQNLFSILRLKIFFENNYFNKFYMSILKIDSLSKLQGFKKLFMILNDFTNDSIWFMHLTMTIFNFDSTQNLSI